MRLGRLLRGEQIHTTWNQILMTVGTPENLPPGDLEFHLMATNEMQLELGGRRILLDMHRRVLYYSARMADTQEAASARSGDTVRLVPGSDTRATITAVPVEDADGFTAPTGAAVDSE